MHPIVQLTVDGAPVAGAFYERLISLSIVDKEGISSDTFDAMLNDGPPDFLALPSKGAIVIPSLGYREGGVREMGRFTVDQINAKCLPYSVAINGKAADLRKGKLKEPSERHFEDKTLGEIVEEIAGEAGLSAKVAESIASHPYKWVAQENETPIHFLERLARRHNALFTVKDGNLVFGERGSGESASGAPMGAIIITPPLVIVGSLSFEFNDRSTFGKVAAYYQDRDKAERVEIEVDGDPEGDAVYRIPEPFADPSEAEKAAESKARQLKRGEGSASVAVAGNTAITAGVPLIFDGIRPGLDGVPWVIETATHTYSKSAGYRTQLDMKLYDGASGSKSASGSGAQGGDATATPAPNSPANAPAAPAQFSSPRSMGLST
jgi:hypothetical protein